LRVAHTQTHTHTHTHTPPCMSMSAYVPIHAYGRSALWLSNQGAMHTHTHTDRHRHTRTHTYVRAHAYTNTHRHTGIIIHKARTDAEGEETDPDEHLQDDVEPQRPKRQKYIVVPVSQSE
jgi:hypothetical protein